MVTMVINYNDGQMDDPWVAHHRDEPACPQENDSPHRMSECGMFKK
jgi:hypothetical protein